MDFVPPTIPRWRGSRRREEQSGGEPSLGAGGASGAPRGGSHQGVIITSGWVSSLGVSGASLSPAYLSPKKTLEDWVPQMSEANTHDSRCLSKDTHPPPYNENTQACSCSSRSALRRQQAPRLLPPASTKTCLGWPSTHFTTSRPSPCVACKICIISNNLL